MYTNHDRLIMAEHDKYGIWYFTNRKKIERSLHIVQALMDYYIRKAERNDEQYWKVGEWTFCWVENDGDIIYKYINPERENIFGN